MRSPRKPSFENVAVAFVRPTKLSRPRRRSIRAAQACACPRTRSRSRTERGAARRSRQGTSPQGRACARAHSPKRNRPRDREGSSRPRRPRTDRDGAPPVERRGDKAVDVVGLADQRARRLYDQTRQRKEVVEHALIGRHPLLGGVQLVKRELSAYRLAHLGKTSRRRRARRVGEGQHLFGVKTRPVPSVAQEENAVDRRLLQHVQRGIEVGFEKTAHIVRRVVRHQGVYLSVHAIVRDIAETVGGKVRAARRSAKPRESAKLLIHRAGVDAPRRAAVFAEDIEEQKL